MGKPTSLERNAMPKAAPFSRILTPLLTSCAMGLALGTASTAYGQAFKGTPQIVVGDGAELADEAIACAAGTGDGPVFAAHLEAVKQEGRR